MRMRKVVKWYLSGLYKKPKGLKKPYNPIIGETFRCYWQHPNGSKASDMTSTTKKLMDYWTFDVSTFCHCRFKI